MTTKKPAGAKASAHLPKPNLSTGSGEIVSPTFLPADLQADLLRLVITEGKVRQERRSSMEGCQTKKKLTANGTRLLFSRLDIDI